MSVLQVRIVERLFTVLEPTNEYLPCVDPGRTDSRRKLESFEEAPSVRRR